MFKYTINAKVKNSPRRVSLVIKTEEMINIHSTTEADYFIEKYNAKAALEKIFGEGNVLDIALEEKTEVLRRTEA